MKRNLLERLTAGIYSRCVMAGVLGRTRCSDSCINQKIGKTIVRLLCQATVLMKVTDFAFSNDQADSSSYLHSDVSLSQFVCQAVHWMLNEYYRTVRLKYQSLRCTGSGFIECLTDRMLIIESLIDCLIECLIWDSFSHLSAIN